MNRVLLWSVVMSVAVVLSACDKKERGPLPKIGAGEVEQRAKLAVGTGGECRLALALSSSSTLVSA